MADNLQDFLEDDVPVRAKRAGTISSTTFKPKVTNQLKSFLEGTGGGLQPISPLTGEETGKQLTEAGFELPFIDFSKPHLECYD